MKIPVKLSWNRLKVSIAGARLSHLVQKDKIWDHGTMTEHVKNIFYQIQKAKSREDAESIRKYVTMNGFQQLQPLIEKKGGKRFSIKAIVTEVSIIGVSAKSNKNSDRFIALIKAKQKKDEDLGQLMGGNENFGIQNFSEQWYFLRQGDWWLLDRVKMC